MCSVDVKFNILNILNSANDSMQSKDCIGLLRYYAWLNKPLLWVVNCLVMVERSWLGNKLFIVV